MIPPRPNVNQRNTAGPSNRANQNEDDDEWRLPVQKTVKWLISTEKGI